MKIEKVYIKNFRSIKEVNISLKDLTILIGNNGTGKTSILEAIHFALSPNFLSSKIKQTDFYNGTNENISIEVTFFNNFDVEIPEGFVKQNVICNKIHLEIKRRQRASPGKSFSDGFTIEHYYVPIALRQENGWIQQRKNGKEFEFTERHLALGFAESDIIPRSFYFGKNRSIQIKRGYNSSMTNVLDDFNWRFINNLQKDKDNYFTEKNNIEEKIKSKVDENAIKKSLTNLNTKLQDFGIPEIGLSIFDSHSPFNGAFLSNTIGNMNIGVDELGSGIEMIISLMFLETLASLSKKSIIIIIDEPELHLHPSLQEKIIKYIKSISSEKQIIVSTHSPYFFKNCMTDSKIKLLVTESKDNNCNVKDSDIMINTFPWSPSWGEINYFAYHMPTVEFFNELYGYLYELSDIESNIKFDNYLVNLGYQKEKIWFNKKNNKQESCTVFYFIRNKIHHGENRENTDYSEKELVYCIDEMIKQIQDLMSNKNIVNNKEWEDDIPF